MYLLMKEGDSTAFYGYEFIFDGTPCSKYGLLLYDIDSNKQSDNIKLTSAGTLITDKTYKKSASMLYGSQQNEALSFNLVFVADPERVENNDPFDRFELQAISSWLSGHNTWKWLKIIQPDLEMIGYKCLITELTEITIGNFPWALSCTVTCDSPYAYMNPITQNYVIDTSPKQIVLRNRSSFNGIYYPKLELTLGAARTIEITNLSNQNQKLKFTNLPASVSTIILDNEKRTIGNDADLNIYPNFNFGWLGFVRGENRLNISANCNLKFICEFPVNVGA